MPSVTTTELGYLGDATRALQTQIKGKQATTTGGASSSVTSNLNGSKVCNSDASVNKSTSSLNSAILTFYLTTITSDGQTQSNSNATQSTSYFYLKDS